MPSHAVTAGGILVLLAATACQTAAPEMKDPPDSATVTRQDDGGTVRVAHGGVLTVRLEATPGTGFSWTVVRNDARVLQAFGESTFEPPPGDGGPAIGRPETQVMTFRGVGRGTDVLELHYLRPFEKGRPPLGRFSITVVVK